MSREVLELCFAVGVLSAAVRDYGEARSVTETEEKTARPNCRHADRRLAAVYTVFSYITTEYRVTLT